MEKKKEEKAKVEKKERKFNSTKVGRTMKTALKAVFPNEAFITSTFVEKVKVMYSGTSKIPPNEINVFKNIFCALTNSKKEEIVFSQYEEKVTN